MVRLLVDSFHHHSYSAPSAFQSKALSVYPSKLIFFKKVSVVSYFNQ